jgi:hypothetical protein
MKKWSGFQNPVYSNTDDEKGSNFWRISGLEQIEDELETSLLNLNASGRAEPERVRQAWALRIDLQAKMRDLVQKYNLTGIASRAGIDTSDKPRVNDQYEQDKVSLHIQEDLQSLKVLRYELKMELEPNALRKSVFVYRLLLWPTMIWLFGVALISQNYRDEPNRSYGSHMMRVFCELMRSPFFIGFSPCFLVLPRLWCYFLEIGIKRDKEYTYLNYTAWAYQIEAIIVAATLFIFSSVSGMLGCLYFSLKVQLELGAILMWRDQILSEGHRPMLLTHLSVIIIVLLSIVFFIINYWLGFLYCWALDKPVSTFSALLCGVAICGTATTAAAQNFVLLYK